MSLKRFSNWFGRASSVAIVAAIGAVGVFHSEDEPKPLEEQIETNISSIPIQVNADTSVSFDPKTLYDEIKSVQTVTIEDGLVSVSPKLQYIFATCAQSTGIPAQVLANKAFAESSFREHAYAPSTQARGLMQFLPDTALETLYDMGQDARYAKIFPETQLITRHLDDKDKFVFGIVAGVDKRALIASILNDPYKSTCMAAEYNKKYLSIFAKDYPDTEITSLHSYLVHWQGLGGARTLMDRFIKDPNQNAISVVNGGADGQIVKNHKSIFYDGESPRSISEMFTYLSDNRGIGNIPIDLDADEVKIPIVYSGLDVESLKEAWKIGPVYISPIPKARPEGLGTPESQTNAEMPSSLRPKARPDAITLALNTP